VLDSEILVLEFEAINGLAAGAVTLGEVPSLAHEAGNDPVESAATKMQRFPGVGLPLLSCAQSAEVLRCAWSDVREQLHDDASHVSPYNNNANANANQMQMQMPKK
jgi:hypothetical protein